MMPLFPPLNPPFLFLFFPAPSFLPFSSFLNECSIKAPSSSHRHVSTFSPLISPRCSFFLTPFFFFWVVGQVGRREKQKAVEKKRIFYYFFQREVLCTDVNFSMCSKENSLLQICWQEVYFLPASRDDLKEGETERQQIKRQRKTLNRRD